MDDVHVYEWIQLLMNGFLGNIYYQWLRSGPKHFVVCRSSCNDLKYDSHLVM